MVFKRPKYGHYWTQKPLFCSVDAPSVRMIRKTTNKAISCISVYYKIFPFNYHHGNIWQFSAFFKELPYAYKVWLSVIYILTMAIWQLDYTKNFFYRSLYLLYHSISPGWRYDKNNKNWVAIKATTFKNKKNLVVIKSHTIYKNDKIAFLRGPLKKNEELF